MRAVGTGLSSHRRTVLLKGADAATIRSPMGRAANALVSLLFAPLWLVTWLQSRHSIGDFDFNQGLIEDVTLPPLKQSLREAENLYGQKLDAGVLQGADGMPSLHNQSLDGLSREDLDLRKSVISELDKLRFIE